MDNKLVVMVQNAGLPATKAESILKTFETYFSIAAEWENVITDVVVTDASQTELIEKAEKGRKILKEKRCEIERTRKELKDASLKEGQCIDGIAKVLKSIIEPLETHLEYQAKFVERLEEELVETKRKERFEKIKQYIAIPNIEYDFRTMSEEMFNLLYESKKKAYEEKIAFEKEVEEARIKKATEQAAEQERIRLENEKLKKEAEEVRILREKEAKKQRKEMEEKLKVEREASAKVLEAEREKNRKEAEEIAKRAAKERAEREAAEAAERAAKAEAARLADLLSRTVCCPNCKHEFVVERRI